MHLWSSYFVENSQNSQFPGSKYSTPGDIFEFRKTKSARKYFAMSSPMYMSLCKRTTSSRITSLELVTPKRQGLAYLMTMSNIIINAHTFWNFICTYLLYASLFNIEKCMNKKVSAFYLHQILIIVISLDLKKWVFY